MVWGTWMAVAWAAAPTDAAWQDVAFDDAWFGRGPIAGRVYYPVLPGTTELDPAGAPYPLVAFMHGWRGSASHYDEVCEALVREGFVVASIDTQSDLVLHMPTYAEDTHRGRAAGQGRPGPGAVWRLRHGRR